MRDPDCLFCKILDGDIPSDIVYQDEIVTAFRDITPLQPTHILIIPNQHIQDSNAITEEHEPIAGHMFRAVRLIAQQEGIAESGYRLIINTGPDGRQEVPHLHLHLLGGGRMQHPMG